MGVASPDEPVEEGVASPAAIRNPGEACILPRDADAAMAHHQHEEARLAFGEAAVDDGPNAFLLGHRQSSSARPPLCPPRLPAPLVERRRLNAAITREARARHAGAMRPAIVRRDDLDVLALPTAIRLLVLDADVGEVDLVIEVR